MKSLQVIAAFSLIALAGLAHSQEQDPSKQCFANLEGKSDFSALRTKVALSDPSNQTLAMLSNRSRAKKGEKALISQWSADVSQCYKLGRDFRQKHSTPQMLAAQNEMQQTFQDLLLKLYAGKLTYGAFAQDRAQSLSRFNAMFKQNEQEIEKNKVAGETVKIKAL